MIISNTEQVEDWLFERAALRGHICDGIKGQLPDGSVGNVAYKDRVTGEIIEVKYVIPT